MPRSHRRPLWPVKIACLLGRSQPAGGWCAISRRLQILSASSRVSPCRRDARHYCICNRLRSASARTCHPSPQARSLCGSHIRIRSSAPRCRLGIFYSVMQKAAQITPSSLTQPSFASTLARAMGDLCRRCFRILASLIAVLFCREREGFEP